MDSLSASLQNLAPGENGSLEYKTTSNGLVDLFFKLVRNFPEDEMKQMIQAILSGPLDGNNIADLFVLLFQTRDARGGKGEKKLFYVFFIELFKKFPRTINSLLGEIRTYGYFKDFMNLEEFIQSIQDNDSIEFNKLYGEYNYLLGLMIQIYADQLRKDEISLNSAPTGEVPELSLAAKFAPREGKKFNKFYKKLVKILFPDSKSANKDYRELVVKLTKALEIPEVLMCANRWDEINFSRVPSLCLNRHRKAFLNEILNGTDLRHPDDEKRNTCRTNLLKASAKGKVCGKVLQPHELTKQLRTSNPSQEEIQVYDAQWKKIIEGVRETMSAFIGNEMKSGAINLGKLVPLVDVSSSMSGTPMEVAIALGIMVSELADPAFRDRFITFHETPSWVNLSDCKTIYDKVLKTSKAPWGTSTNFQAAFELILRVCVENRLQPEDIPDLIVFSDMQFNEADRKGVTMHQYMTQRFSEEGMKVSGKPWSLPKIIYWNLRGNTRGLPVEANTPNVQMLSGFSPSLLKLLLDGEPLEIQTVDEEGNVSTQEITPEMTLRKALDDHRYYPIRRIISDSTEFDYTFVDPDLPSSDEESSDDE
jgi:hypothetical protein